MMTLRMIAGFGAEITVEDTEEGRVTKGQIPGEAKEDVKPDGKNPKDHKALHQVGITRIELRQTAIGGKGI